MNSYDLLGFQETNGLGLTAYSINECEMVLKYPEDTNSSWVRVVWNIWLLFGKTLLCFGIYLVFYFKYAVQSTIQDVRATRISV